MAVVVACIVCGRQFPSDPRVLPQADVCRACVEDDEQDAALAAGADDDDE